MRHCEFAKDAPSPGGKTAVLVGSSTLSLAQLGLTCVPLRWEVVGPATHNDCVAVTKIPIASDIDIAEGMCIFIGFHPTCTETHSTTLRIKPAAFQLGRSGCETPEELTAFTINFCGPAVEKRTGNSH